MEKKNQHYIPRFHLRQWSSDGKLISLYNKYNQKFIDNKAPIKNMASKDYFYDKNGKAENLLGKIESTLSQIYQKIINNVSLPELTDYECNLLYLHFILSNERTEAAGNDYESLEKAKLQTLLEIYQAHGRHTDIDVSTIKEKVKFQFSSNNAIKAAFKYYPLIMDLEISLIQNTSTVEFITSDYPSIKYNLWSNIRQFYFGWGLSSIGLMYIFPICPKLALIAYDSAIYSIKNLKNNVVRIQNDDDITEINRLMLLNSNQNVFFSKNTTFDYITKMLFPIKEYIKQPNTVQVFGNAEGMIIANNVRRINYNANLNFLSLHPNSLLWPATIDSAWLLRPTSENIAEKLGI